MKLFSMQILEKGLFFSLVALFFISCKKNNPQPEPEPEPVVRTSDQMIRDSIYYYYKLYSLWADQYIPQYDNTFEFTDQYTSADAVLLGLKSLTPAYPNYASYGGFLDRFSFLDGLNNYHTGTQSRLRMDRNSGYGLYISMGTADSKVARPVIYFVEGGSPADKAGLKRSDMITSINGDNDFAVAVTCDASGCKPVDQNALNQMRTRVLNALEGGGLQLELLRQDQSTYSQKLAYTSYIIDPLYRDTVYQYSTKNVGYLALSSFEEIENNNDNQQKIDAAFQGFENKHIEDLIVDLRYNTGGYVDAAVYVANKIGGSVAAGELMLTYICNAYMDKTHKGTNGMFSDTYYRKTSNLNLRKVYFLVSETTASAAEMLINVLKPYLDVQIIATGTHTYGKPVGFFEQIIENKVSFWPASFQLKNAAGFSDYWDGLLADRRDVTDYIFLESGDTQETMLETALEDAVPGSKKKANARKSTNQIAPRMLQDQQQINRIPEKGLLKSQ
ncbi:S41 family peptidase [Sphingobacterium sp. UBA6320]|jgi:carboxyl-terminal processing protease|uniref:S41 family peptidase n=1 Tax=Sphingobacterium sp. UBA6320 TaxID=1947510 RepID=UPI0025EACB5A|nr:S41 family peptidase [Sphingobacterium sp. UBA6320]